MCRSDFADAAVTAKAFGPRKLITPASNTSRWSLGCSIVCAAFVWLGVKTREILVGFSLELFFWSSVAVVAFVTFGYPILLAFGGLFVRRRSHVLDAEPPVSLVIAAHNQEDCIGRK